MVRTQIQLTDRQARRLRAQAKDRGVSLAEIIRRYVEKGLSEEEHDRAALYERATRVVGCEPIDARYPSIGPSTPPVNTSSSASCPASTSAR